MRKIPLSGKLGRDKYALVDDDDYEKLARYKWHLQKVGQYAARNVWEKKTKTQHTVLMHRAIIQPPAGMFIDHEDTNKLNNQKSNLRVCTISQNQHNRPPQKNNRSGFKGVGFDKKSGKWRARISLNSESILLGFFNTPEKAAKAYEAAAMDLHKDFARVA